MIEFYLDPRAGVAPYLQIVQQVRRAMKLGLLHEGDQLPTVREVVRTVAINPNTVLKAYRELEHEGLVVGRAGVGTFVTKSYDPSSYEAHAALLGNLRQWVATARAAGVDDESIEGLVHEVLRGSAREDVS